MSDKNQVMSFRLRDTNYKAVPEEHGADTCHGCVFDCQPDCQNAPDCKGVIFVVDPDYIHTGDIGKMESRMKEMRRAIDEYFTSVESNN
ncbi:hypothetical protein EniLVp02_0227 [Vibrio phage EniLVp02]